MKLQDRYELRDQLGRGGMGVVYKAYDTLMKREVALKTILDVDNTVVMDLFYKEWGVQAAIVHPNVAEIYDIGELEHEGQRKPFFVMPLLPGVGLDVLIAERSPRLTVQRIVHIFDQACRGLQAAHERGLIHRDLKPSNLFVMEDDSVKLIDFGIAHVAETGAKTSLKGTLSYMAPEQLKMEQPTARSDVFSLGVTCYETFCGRRPFRGKTDYEISQAILHQIPPPISELNPSVNDAISQVVHKALAKDPWHRFGTAREFGEALQKALRNEPLEIFSGEKIKPRLDRAAKAFEEGDYEFAREIIAELEAEGRLDPEITFLRRRLDQAVKQKQIQSLLEAARRYQEAHEHGLALRKVQEALDLDPQDNDAQALQHSIEKERRERQIGEWLDLARKHLENDAFGPARQAIDSILAVKSTDTEALRLQAEIDRRERELKREREEKAKLYDAARHAFDRGDVTAALSKLENLVEMDRERPDTGTGRSGAYQQFYQQVRSEHDELKASYDRARTLLAEEKFGEALALCNQRLAKYPNHALFQALRYDVEQRQRQKLSSYIADVDRRLDAERDLDKRLAILEEALASYPDEPHFQQAAKLVRDRRDLVNSIASKAAFFAEKGRYQEALDQWEVLRSIHPQYPDLDAMVGELRARRDEQKVQEEKTRLAERIDRLIEAGDHDGAMLAAAEALERYPGDPTLQELQRLADKSRERTLLASQLLAAAREAIDSGRVSEGLDALREARRTNEADPVVRTVLVNALLDQARTAISHDRDRAEAYVDEALEHDPSNQPALLLRGQIEERKKEEFLTWALTEARRLQSENEIDGARAIVEQGLALYPADPRLKQLRGTLERARERTAIVPAPGKGSGDRTQIVPGAKTAKPPAEPPAQAPAPARPAAEPVAQRKTPAAAAAPPAAPAAAPAKPPAAAKPKFSPAMLAVAGGGVLALAAVGAMAVFGVFGGGKEAPAALYTVNVRTSPPGAKVFVDDQPCPSSPCQTELAPGERRIEARLAGYWPRMTVVTVDPANPPGDEPISLLLDPMAPALEIASDLEGGEVRLNGEVVGKLDQGQLLLENLPAGEHTLVVDDRGARIEARIEVEHGRPPVVRSLKTTSLKAALVASLGEEAQAYSDASGAAVALDGLPVGQIGAEPLELSGLREGPHELRIGPEDGALNLYFDLGQRPMLTAALKSDRNVGSLRIDAGMDDVTVLLNGEPYRRKTSRGRVVVYLRPGPVKVGVAKDGYVSPPEQTVEVVKGGLAQATFELKPMPKTSSLRIAGGVAGAEVYLDDTKLGEVSSNGTFFAANVKPGRHKIELRKPLYETRTIERTWKEGDALEIPGAMEAIVGTLSVNVTPGDVRGLSLTLRREGEAQSRPLSERSIAVPEGEYSVIARAPGYKEFAAMGLRVVRGQTKTAEIRLEKLPEERAAPKRGFDLEAWAPAAGWEKQGEVYRKTGGGFVVTPESLGPGAYAFAVWLQSGRRIEFVLAYQDEKNHVLYEVEKRTIKRSRLVNGRKTDQREFPHKGDRDGFMSFQVDLSPGEATLRLRVGDEWQELDRYAAPAGVNLAAGKFGFDLGKNTQLGLSHFTFFPR